MLTAVGQDGLHSTGSFSAPGADYVVVYLATSPDRGSDGRFLTENSARINILSSQEIAAGSWRESDTIQPGTYFAMLRATNSCEPSSSCAEGFSNVMRLDVPKPAQSFAGSVKGGVYAAELTLTVNPAGDDVPYKLCWTRTRGRAPRCKHRVVSGFDWTSEQFDTVYLAQSDLRLSRGQRKMTFNWYVDGRKVASRKSSLGRLFD